MLNSEMQFLLLGHGRYIRPYASKLPESLLGTFCLRKGKYLDAQHFKIIIFPQHTPEL